MQGHRLYKSEKLCSRTAIDRLFHEGNSYIAYPLRAVYAPHPASDVPARFLITIPKKKIRHAVDRVLLRRRTREAYRLMRRELLHPQLEQAGMSIDIAFLYLSDEIAPFSIISTKMKQLLERIANAAAKASAQAHEHEAQHQPPDDTPSATATEP